MKKKQDESKSSDVLSMKIIHQPLNFMYSDINLKSNYIKRGDGYKEV